MNVSISSVERMCVSVKFKGTNSKQTEMTIAARTKRESLQDGRPIYILLAPPSQGAANQLMAWRMLEGYEEVKLT